MIRGEIWLAHVGQKHRPVLVLTRSDVIDVRALVTVAEITTTARGLSVEVPLDHSDVGLPRPCVVNCDGLHTVSKSTLTSYVGTIDDVTLGRVCRAVTAALGC